METESTASLTVPTPDGTADAFAAYPAGEGAHPGVLFYMDAIGLRPVVHDLVRQLASHGYYVLAPNVFYRHGTAPLFHLPEAGDPESFSTFFGKVMPLLQAHTSDKATSDAGAYLDFLRQQPQVSGDKVGVTGYCMGGMLALRTAATYPDRVAAAASFHAGHLVTEAQDSPHRQVGSITADVHIGHAQDDASMPAEDIAQLDSALDAAGVSYTSEVYPGGHGFTMSDTAAYSPPALERHWERLLPLLDRTLPASG